MPETHLRASHSRLRGLVVEEHDVYGTACVAPLRTEGLDVVDAAPGHDVVGLDRMVEPTVVLIDAAPPTAALLPTLAQLYSLTPVPTVALFSSAPQDGPDPCLAELPFLANADVSARELFRALLRGSDKPASQLGSE